jgi:TRAP-type mannitol/chloroaromatic compound transport system substrate-binding protein
MERRAFLRKAAATAGAAALAAVSYPGKPTGAQARFRWRLGHSFAPTSPILATSLGPLADDLRAMSGGALDITVYGSGELVPAFGLFDAVKDGTLQMMYSASYYWAGRLPAAQFTCSVPFGMTAQQTNAWFYYGGGHEVWRQFYAKQGLMVWAAGNTGMEVAGWFRRELNGVEDLKGLRMRITGLGRRVLESLGANAVLLPALEIAPAMQAGTLDACEWMGPYYDFELGLHRAAPYCYAPGWHQPSTANELTVNLAAWKGLPRELQLMVEQAAYRLNMANLAQFEARNQEFLRRIRQDGRIAFRQLPADVLKALYRASEQVNQAVADADADARTVYESYKRFRDGIRGWTSLGEGAYQRALGTVGANGLELPTPPA